jgi:hypothetical protein
MLALFYELTNFTALKLGTTPLPRQLHVLAIDDDWRLAFNCTLEPADHEGIPIPAMTFVVYRGDFPIGLVGPFEGGLLGGVVPGTTEAELSAAIAAAGVGA